MSQHCLRHMDWHQYGRHRRISVIVVCYHRSGNVVYWVWPNIRLLACFAIVIMVAVIVVVISRRNSGVIGMIVVMIMVFIVLVDRRPCAQMVMMIQIMN